MKLEFIKGQTHMDGKTALSFVRSRHSETGGGDYNRSLRQQALLKALRQKIVSLGVSTKLYNTARALKGALETDITFLQSAQFIALFGDVTKYEFHTLVLGENNVFMPSVSEDGQYIYVPKKKIGAFESVHEFIAHETAAFLSASASGSAR
jgi:anionic cell wall polymer biosynthesis LytR-Cps2A-Psr (LCP) family protein